MKKILLTLLFLFLNGCGDTEKVFTPLAKDAVILAFGDSLTYGTGTNKNSSYPAILEKLTQHKVINKGVPGEISGAGLKRLPKLLDQYKPSLLILIHGGNDILRKIPRKQTTENLRKMIVLAKQRDINVVMLGVPGFGLLLLKSAEFYQQIATEEDIPIDLEALPDILSSSSLKSDQVHPNAKGYQIMAEAIYKLLQDNGAL
jgi:lysophospholipase L1-like esterase